jgi:predicted dehydrogenase
MQKVMPEENIGVAIVGCGLIGRKRAQALGSARLRVCADKVLARAEAAARLSAGAEATTDWQNTVARDDIKVVIVSTTNDALAPVALAALHAGKPVLIEKPAARTVNELETIISAAKRAGVPVRVGFNHRYHPALRQAHALFKDGQLGDLMFIRGRYGHGGRLGYEKEWRANPALSGGGELIDQGVHLIDLARWFLGDFNEVSGFTHTYYWQMPVDDNAFMLLKTPARQVAFLHVSCTEWKNLFSLEIYGKQAKLHVEGLGGSYGSERLTYYKMLPQMGPPETTVWTYPKDDDSWQLEFKEFLEDIRLGKNPSASLDDARAALQIVETIYKKSEFDF